MSTVQQLYTGCLAEAAYFIRSGSDAVVIDPLRETKQYLELAEKHNVKIKFILETHFHADFVSGHVDLARATGATIVFGPTASVDGAFAFKCAADGEVLAFGDATITVLHTPGHTMESSCYLLQDKGADKPKAIFTGDTLFIGDVGRPDLVASVDPKLTPDVLAGHMYDSLRNKLMPLPDDITVYPGHGAGSACGKNMSAETFDTLGHQKQVNYALNPATAKDDFVLDLITGQPPAPMYFKANVMMNKGGTAATSIDSVMSHGKRALSVDEFRTVMNTPDEATQQLPLVVDTRPALVFEATGTVPNAFYCSTEDGSFAPWLASAFPDIKRKLLVIMEKPSEQVDEVLTRLARVGFDNVAGYLDGGIDAWLKAGEPVVRTALCDADTVVAAFEKDPENFQLVDVRRATEFGVEHMKVAKSYPMDPNGFEKAMAELDPKKGPVYCICRTGYRGMIFASALTNRYGFAGQTINVRGGHFALCELAAKIGGLSDRMCPMKARQEREAAMRALKEKQAAEGAQ